MSVAPTSCICMVCELTKDTIRQRFSGTKAFFSKKLKHDIITKQKLLRTFWHCFKRNSWWNSLLETE